MDQGNPASPAAGKSSEVTGQTRAWDGACQCWGGKHQPGLKELRDEVRASSRAGQIVDRQRPGPIPGGRASGW